MKLNQSRLPIALPRVGLIAGSQSSPFTRCDLRPFAIRCYYLVNCNGIEGGSRLSRARVGDFEELHFTHFVSCNLLIRVD